MMIEGMKRRAWCAPSDSIRSSHPRLPVPLIWRGQVALVYRNELCSRGHLLRLVVTCMVRAFGLPYTCFAYAQSTVHTLRIPMHWRNPVDPTYFILHTTYPTYLCMFVWKCNIFTSFCHMHDRLGTSSHSQLLLVQGNHDLCFLLCEHAVVTIHALNVMSTTVRVH